MDTGLSMKLRVAARMAQSTVNGPGTRSVVWLQGCPFRCPGCFNQDFLSSDGGDEITGGELLEWCLSIDESDGITFSGGEPLAQAEALLPVVSAIRENGRSIILFTGYDESQLRSDSVKRKIVEKCDLIVAGPFDQSSCCSEPLRASSNQKLIFVSDRFDVGQLRSARAVEFTVSSDGTATVTGFPTA